MKKGIVTSEQNGNRIDFEVVFKALNSQLAEANQVLELICGGGYALQVHGYRGTVDVDAFYQSNDTIDRIIRDVGNTFKINRPDEVWLNNSISNMNRVPSDIYVEIVHQFSNLTVKVVKLDYLIGMKLESARKEDKDDAANLIKANGYKNPLALFSKLRAMHFNVDPSILLDIFESAYGMEWLEHFYSKHQDDFLKLL